jgi:hypothetical protein
LIHTAAHSLPRIADTKLKQPEKPITSHSYALVAPVIAQNQQHFPYGSGLNCTHMLHALSIGLNPIQPSHMLPSQVRAIHQHKVLLHPS